MRHVKYQEYVKNDQSQWEFVWKEEEAIFHEFGVDYEEFEAGPGNFSVAIIELPDGTIKTPRVEHIKFIDSL